MPSGVMNRPAVPVPGAAEIGARDVPVRRDSGSISAREAERDMALDVQPRDPAGDGVELLPPRPRWIPHRLALRLVRLERALRHELKADRAGVYPARARGRVVVDRSRVVAP